MADILYLCRREELPTQGAKNFVVDGRDVAVFNMAGEFVAHSGVCKHNGFKLEHCQVKGDTVTCPRHLWVYRISDGQGIKPTYTRLDNYRLELRDDEVWIDLEDAAPQDDFDTSAYQW